MKSPHSVTHADVVRRARSADLIVSCVDHDTPRLAAALLCHRFLKIHLDVGTGVTMDERGERLLAGDVRLLLPGQGCICCVGGLNAEEEARIELHSPPGALKPIPPRPWDEGYGILSLPGQSSPRKNGIYAWQIRHSSAPSTAAKSDCTPPPWSQRRRCQCELRRVPASRSSQSCTPVETANELSVISEPARRSEKDDGAVQWVFGLMDTRQPSTEQEESIEGPVAATEWLLCLYCSQCSRFVGPEAGVRTCRTGRHFWFVGRLPRHDPDTASRLDVEGEHHKVTIDRCQAGHVWPSGRTRRAISTCPVCGDPPVEPRIKLHAFVPSNRDAEDVQWQGELDE